MNQDIIDIIKKVKEKITDDSDMAWTCYDNAKQLRDQLDLNIRELQIGDTNSLEQLKILLLPTASLQEHSICNGWAGEYLELASKFDDLYSIIKNADKSLL